MTIDAHCHVHAAAWVRGGGDARRPDYLEPWLRRDCGPEEVAARQREAGVDRAIVFPVASALLDVAVANQFVVDLARRDPRFVAFAVVDDEPARWVAQGARGLKEHTYGQRLQRDAAGRDIYSDRFAETYRYMERHGLPLVLHAGNNRVGRLREDLLPRTPALPIVLAHLGADFPTDNHYRPRAEQVRDTLAALADCPNVHFDTSAILEADVLQLAVDNVSAERLLFGSDYPFDTPLAALQRLRSLRGLGDAERARIEYGNAQRLVGL